MNKYKINQITLFYFKYLIQDKQIIYHIIQHIYINHLIIIFNGIFVEIFLILISNLLNMTTINYNIVTTLLLCDLYIIYLFILLYIIYLK